MKNAAKTKGSGSSREPYEKPAVIHREMLETIAVICDNPDPINGKTGVGDGCTNTYS